MALFDLVTVDRREHTVTALGPDAWEVSSATKPGVSYVVRRVGRHVDLFVCACRSLYPGRSTSRSRATPCRHARAVSSLLVGVESGL